MQYRSTCSILQRHPLVDQELWPTTEDSARWSLEHVSEKHGDHVQKFLNNASGLLKVYYVSITSLTEAERWRLSSLAECDSRLVFRLGSTSWFVLVFDLDNFEEGRHSSDAHGNSSCHFTIPHQP
jgi:hypothetical protein